jgi:hypothetical protein
VLTTFRCAQALTMLRNDPEVTFEHVREIFTPCIEHRIQVRPDASPAVVMVDTIASVAEPGAEGDALPVAA